MWRFVTGLRATAGQTCQKLLKGQDESPLSLDRVWGFFMPVPSGRKEDETMNNDWNPSTKAVHAGTRRSQYGEVSEAIFLTQGFVYDSAEHAEARFLESGPDEFIYARYGNPTVAMFEERIAALEGTEDAFATASGMAAVSGALMSMLRAGDHVVSARARQPLPVLVKGPSEIGRPRQGRSLSAGWSFRAHRRVHPLSRTAHRRIASSRATLQWRRGSPRSAP